MDERPPIPADLKRRVLVEAGHRCAVPTCRFPTTEIAHIVPFAKVKDYTFDNLIALCPNCHTRYDAGEIDRQAMYAYKRKLLYLSDRYSHYELAALDYLRKNPRVVVLGHLSITTLLDEGLVEVEKQLQTIEFADGYKAAVTMLVRLTDAGNRFLSSWANPEDHDLEY